jgi:hypothetical protein
VVDDHHGREYIGRVAVFTDIRCQGVCRILARGIRTVVAIYAIAGDRRVVEERRQPASRSVAIVTGIAAGNVCRVLADGNEAVMAGTATPEHLRMINCHHGRKYIGGVAVLADIRRLYVKGILADCLSAIVTTDAVTGDV